MNYFLIYWEKHLPSSSVKEARNAGGSHLRRKLILAKFCGMVPVKGLPKQNEFQVVSTTLWI